MDDSARDAILNAAAKLAGIAAPTRELFSDTGAGILRRVRRDYELAMQVGSKAGMRTMKDATYALLNDGIIAGEQLTPGAPWRIRLTDDLRARVAEEAPEGYLTMYQAMRRLGVSRQTVWQRVKRGEIEAIHVRRGRNKGLRLKLICSQSDLFSQAS